MKRTTRFTLALIAGASASLFAAPALAAGQDQDHDHDHDHAHSHMDEQAKKVWDKAIKATYGKLAKDHSSIKNVTTKGTLSVPAQGMNAQFSSINIPGKGTMESVDLPGMGEFQQGAIDGVAWSFNAMMGPRILEGLERDQILDSSNLFADLDWESNYNEIKFVGEETITLQDGSESAVHVLELHEIGEEEPSMRYYDSESGLLIKQSGMVATNGVNIPNTMYMSDYRDVQGMMLPFSTTTIIGPNQMVITLDDVEINGEVDASAITPPDSVKELMEDEG